MIKIFWCFIALSVLYEWRANMWADLLVENEMSEEMASDLSDGGINAMKWADCFRWMAIVQLIGAIVIPAIFK